MKTVFDLIDLIEKETGASEIAEDARRVAKSDSVEYRQWCDFLKDWEHFEESEAAAERVAYETLQYILWYLWGYPKETWDLLNPDEHALLTLNDYIARRDEK